MFHGIRRTAGRRLDLLVRAALVPALVAAASCSHNNPSDEGYLPEQPVVIEVKNDNYLDVNIYTIVDETTRRLGSVTGNSSDTFRARLPGVQAAGLRLRATAVGLNGAYISGVLSVTTDQVVLLHIAPNLFQSSVSVHDTL